MFDMSQTELLFVSPDIHPNSDSGQLFRTLIDASQKYDKVQVQSWLLTLRRNSQTARLPLPAERVLTPRHSSAKRRLVRDAARCFSHVPEVTSHISHIIGVIPDTAGLCLRLQQLFFRHSRLVLLQTQTLEELMYRRGSGSFTADEREALGASFNRWVQAADVVYSVGQNVYNFYNELYRHVQPPVDHRVIEPSISSSLLSTDVRDILIYVCGNLTLRVQVDRYDLDPAVKDRLTRHQISLISKDAVSAVQKALKDLWFMAQHCKSWNSGIRVAYLSTDYAILTPRSGESRRDFTLRKREAESAYSLDSPTKALSLSSLSPVRSEASVKQMRPTYTEEKSLTVLIQQLRSLGVVLLHINPRTHSLVCHTPDLDSHLTDTSQVQAKVTRLVQNVNELFQRFLVPYVMRHVRRPEVRHVELAVVAQGRDVVLEARRRIDVLDHQSKNTTALPLRLH